MVDERGAWREGEATRPSRLRAVATGPIVRVALTIAVLLALLQGIDVGSVGALFGQFRPSYFALAVVVAILANVLGALAWQSVLEALGVVFPRREVARLYVVGLFFALFTPGGIAGDLVRTFELQRRSGRGVEGFTSIVVTRVLSVGALAILGAISAVAILPGLVSSQITIAVLGLSMVALVALLMSGRPLRPFAGRLPWRRLAHVAEGFLDSVEVLRTKPRALAAATVLYGAAPSAHRARHLSCRARPRRRHLPGMGPGVGPDRESPGFAASVHQWTGSSGAGVRRALLTGWP